MLDERDEGRAAHQVHHAGGDVADVAGQQLANSKWRKSGERGGGDIRGLRNSLADHLQVEVHLNVRGRVLEHDDVFVGDGVGGGVERGNLLFRLLSRLHRSLHLRLCISSRNSLSCTLLQRTNRLHDLLDKHVWENEGGGGACRGEGCEGGVHDAGSFHREGEYRGVGVWLF